MCGFDAHRVTPPLEYGLLLRSRASKVLRAGRYRFIRCYADVILPQVGCVLRKRHRVHECVCASTGCALSWLVVPGVIRRCAELSCR